MNTKLLLFSVLIFTFSSLDAQHKWTISHNRVFTFSFPQKHDFVKLQSGVGLDLTAYRLLSSKNNWHYYAGLCLGARGLTTHDFRISFPDDFMNNRLDPYKSYYEYSASPAYVGPSIKIKWVNPEKKYRADFSLTYSYSFHITRNEGLIESGLHYLGPSVPEGYRSDFNKHFLTIHHRSGLYFLRLWTVQLEIGALAGVDLLPVMIGHDNTSPEAKAHQWQLGIYLESTF